MTNVISNDDTRRTKLPDHFIDKYPLIKEYLFSDKNDKFPVFYKLLCTILYLRRHLGCAIDPTDAVYNDGINAIDSLIFQNVENGDFPKVLQYVVNFASTYVNSFNDFPTKDKISIIDRLIQYTKI